MKKLFIDTGAWIALNNKKDKHHIAAITANKHFLDSGYFYVTSDYIMDETYTLLRYDIGHERTVEFGRKIKSLEKSGKIKIIHIEEDMKEKAWEVFEKYHDKDFSFTDCTSFIVMKKLNTKEVFSFDKHFEQYGFVKLPVL